MMALLAQIPQPIWVLILFALMTLPVYVAYIVANERGLDDGFRAGYDLGKRNVEVKHDKGSTL
jgi:hypothetical protein